MFLRIFKDTTVPKYKSGKWLWDDQTESYRYVAQKESSAEPECLITTPIQRGLFQFKYYLDQEDEIIFRDEFARSTSDKDADVITIQDIKNFVLFMAPSRMLTDKFINFIYTKTVDKFLHAIVIYFEYFLKLVEFLLIRRDELNEKYAKIETLESVKIKRMLSNYMSQYRLLVSREYCKILLGTGDVRQFHHISPKGKISEILMDREFHEAFAAFITQFIWIAHHRRAYEVINYEVNRLLRSDHFNMAKTKDADNINFSRIEQQILYGKNDKRACFRIQKSPLVNEILNVEPENFPILWIGEHKYRGTNPRVYELEREFVVPESQTSFTDITHGILGHSKRLYNTMLILDWHAVRLMKFSKCNNDPHRIIRQPYLDLPDLQYYNKKFETYEPYINLKEFRYDPKNLELQKNLWKNRDKIIHRRKMSKIQNDIILRCEKEIEDMETGPHIDREAIIKEFYIQKGQRKVRENLNVNPQDISA